VVYNTSAALEGEGTYVWTKVGSGSGTDFTGISVAEGTGTTVTGTGTVESPLKVDIATNGVTTGMIQDGQVTAAKLNAMGASNGQVLKYDGSAWVAGVDSDTKDGGITTLTGQKGITAEVSGNTGTITLPAGTNGQVLKSDGTNWVANTDAQGVTAVNVTSNGLTSTGGTTPQIGLPTTSTNGVVLKYDAATSKWVPQADAQGVTSVSGSKGINTVVNASSVEISLPAAVATSQLLAWKDGEWRPANLKRTSTPLTLEPTNQFVMIGGQDVPSGVLDCYWDHVGINSLLGNDKKMYGFTLQNFPIERVINVICLSIEF
jgi:hypothetical protein